MRYLVSREGGCVISEHRTELGALKSARKHCLQLGTLTVHEFASKHATGRPIMRVAFDIETDWKGTPLLFWNDGSPVLEG